jgi:hypothetical protein
MGLELYTQPSQFTNGLSATTFFANSATINVVDITISELSGFNVTGNTSISGNLYVTQNITSDSITVSTLRALSGVINVLDIEQVELSGFLVTGNVTVSGRVNASSGVFESLTAKDIAIAGGNLGQIIVDSLSGYPGNIVVGQLQANFLTAGDAFVHTLTADEIFVNSLTATRFMAGTNNRIESSANNSYIIGDNILAAVSGFTYVNNLSVTGSIRVIGDVTSKNINNISISLGAGDQESNLAIGVSALQLNSLGTGNIAIGRNALARTTTGLFSATLIRAGSGYQTTPIVTVSGGNPTITATISAILATSIFQLSSFPTFPLSALSADPNYSSSLSAITAFNGVISQLIITNRGGGYTGTPVITFSGGDFPSQIIGFLPASAFPVMNTASNNIALGFNAGSTISTGEDNLLMGTDAGREIVTGERNTIIGNYNAAYPDSNNNIILGYNNDLRNYSNVILIGNYLTATKSNFAFMSALNVGQLEADRVSFAQNLIVSNQGVSATSIIVTALTAISATIRNFDAVVDTAQINRTGAISGQVIYYDGNRWLPAFQVSQFPGTRLHDFQLTSYDTGFNVITADTSYCGVAANVSVTGVDINDSIWKITRLKYNDAGIVYETGVLANQKWTQRYTLGYIIIPTS